MVQSSSLTVPKPQCPPLWNRDSDSTSLSRAVGGIKSPCAVRALYKALGTQEMLAIVSFSPRSPNDGRDHSPFFILSLSKQPPKAQTENDGVLSL